MWRPAGEASRRAYRVAPHGERREGSGAAGRDRGAGAPLAAPSLAARSDGAGGTAGRSLGLDVVRACAIALVMVSHGADVFAAFWGARPPAWLSLAGVFGVELFFVLSGFLIGELLLRIAAAGGGLRGWAVFMLRRWMRTLPLYYVAVALMLVLWRPLGPRWSHLLLYGTLTQNLFWPMPADNWFGVSWSLAVEEWFYLLFSLPTLLLARLDRGRRTPWLVVGAFAGWGLLARALVPPGADFGQAVYKVTAFRMDAIAYGVAAALLLRPPAGGRSPARARDAAAPLRHPALLLAAGLGVVGFVWVEVSGAGLALPPVFFRSLFLPVLAAGYALCLPAALRLRLAGGVLGRGLAGTARWLSRHAFGLYVVHLTVLEVASWTVFVAGWPRPVAVLLGVGGSAALAVAAWHLVERPFLRLRPPQPEGSPAVPLPDGEAAAVIGSTPGPARP